MEELDVKLHMKMLGFRQKQWEEWVSKRKPFSVLFELTPTCNMNCVHCYMQNVHKSNELTYDEIISILDILHSKGILFVLFTGGEILTRTDFIDIYMYAKRKGFLIELFSNGLYFDDEIIDVLKKYPPLYIDISLYGACEETYYNVTKIKDAFDKVISNCKKIRDAGINLSLRSPIIKETVNEMAAMKKIADELSLPFACTFELCPTIDKDDEPLSHKVDLSTILKCEFDDYYRQVDNGEREDVAISMEVLDEFKNNRIFSCNVAMNSFVIDYEGKMCPCMKLKHRGIGLLDNNFDDIWEKFSMYHKLKASDNYKCKNCDYRYFCDICPAEMDFLYDDFEYRKSNMCKLARARKEFYCKEKRYEDILKEIENE